MTSWTVASLSQRSHFTANYSGVVPQLLAFTDTPPLKAGNSAGVVDRYLQDMPMLNLYRAHELPAQADRIAEQLLRTPEGRRAVQPFYIMAFALKASEYPVDALGIYERGWIDVSRDTAGLAELAWRLDRRGAKLDFIYCDNENDLTPWTLGQERFVEIYASAAARERMPARLREFDPAALRFMTPEYHEWMIHLGTYAQQIKIEGLRKALCDSGLMSPWSETGGTAAVNFFAMRTSFRLYDLNNWEIEHQTLVDGRTSCPVAYTGGRGFRYKDKPHHPIWCSFVDGLNHARSAAATSEICLLYTSPSPRD